MRWAISSNPASLKSSQILILRGASPKEQGARLCTPISNALIEFVLELTSVIKMPSTDRRRENRWEYQVSQKYSQKVFTAYAIILRPTGR